jgi:hypothetical protein|tara:strand:+ start:87 stop:458 length:372 start_codon:yes stop_codon:yes gene_type:complete
MSKFMLNDEDAINDVNPFVKHDFSLPGSVRQSGGFDNFSNTTISKNMFETSESVYCSFGSCETQSKPTNVFGTIHPRRNIDTGVECDASTNVKVGVADQGRVPYFGIFLIAMFITLVLSYTRR